MWAIWAVVYLCVAVAVHMVVCRLPMEWNIVAKFLGVGGFLGLSLVVHEIWLYGIRIEAISALLLYACLCELYIFLFALVSSSISVSLLIRLRSGDLTLKDIDSLYSNAFMVEQRLEKLLATGLVHRRPQGYVVTEQGRRLVRCFGVLRVVFRHLA